MMALLTDLGKVPVHVKKDVPGFVGNRLQHALWREAIELVEEGVCDAQTIDLVIKNSFWRRLAVLGPLENADLVGNDLTLDIHHNVLAHLNHRRGPSPYLQGLVDAGRLGFKTGHGFRNWTEAEKTALREKVTAQLTHLNAVLDGKVTDRSAGQPLCAIYRFGMFWPRNRMQATQEDQDKSGFPRHTDHRRNTDKTRRNRR